MLKKGFLLKPKRASKNRLSWKKKGKCIIMEEEDRQDELKSSLPFDNFPFDKFPHLDPLEIALIKDTMDDEDFQFVCGSALPHWKGSVGMDDEVGPVDIPPMVGHDMSDSFFLSVVSGPGGPSLRSSRSDCCDNTTDGGGGSKPEVGCINESRGCQFQEGKVYGDTIKREIQCRHKVRLGKNFLLIDRTLRQNLQSVSSFHFLHRRSLSIVELQPQGHSNPDMQVDDEEASFPEVQMQTPISPVSYEVSLTIQSFLLSQDYEEQLPPPSLDSPLLLDPLSDSIMVFHAEGSKRIRAPRIGSLKSDATNSAHFSGIRKVKVLRHGRSSRAPRSCSTRSRELRSGPIAGKHKRELRIENCFNDPSLFRPPRR